MYDIIVQFHIRIFEYIFELFLGRSRMVALRVAVGLSALAGVLSITFIGASAKEQWTEQCRGRYLGFEMENLLSAECKFDFLMPSTE